MSISLQFGPETFRNYKRLNYTFWHALAEFVDNSTQSYFDNRDALDKAYADEGEPGRLEVSIVYDRREEEIRISDTAMGMSLEEMEQALIIGKPPLNPSGRCRYGMGLKTAATWMGDSWEVRTKKLGSSVGYVVSVDVEKVAVGDMDLPVVPLDGQDPAKHYTIVTIRKLNAKPQTKTHKKIKDFLRSMYREDIRSGGPLLLEWNGEQLRWDPSEWKFMKMPSGDDYYKELEFAVSSGRRVQGWVGVLEKGSRGKAGFSILHSGRVVKGWPESWRPGEIFGQVGGSNDLVNQRLIGEIRLDDFAVTHTKDGIVWSTGEEEEVETGIAERVRDLRDRAAKPRKGDEESRGPSDVDVKDVVAEVEEEMTSAEMVDLMQITSAPPPEVVEAQFEPLVVSAGARGSDFTTSIEGVEIAVYLSSDVSPNDPYLYVDSKADDRVEIVVNMMHPCIRLLDRNGFASHLRHCIYDGVAEWQARARVARLDPDTIKTLKDRLLRVKMEIERHEMQAEEDAERAG